MNSPQKPLISDEQIQRMNRVLSERMRCLTQEEIQEIQEVCRAGYKVRFSWDSGTTIVIDADTNPTDDTRLPLDEFNAKAEAMLAEWEAMQEKEGAP